jgi:Domain of unknown function (DUF4286)
MTKIAYSVACTFSDSAVAEEWAAWLRNGHLADVCAAGAEAAQVVKRDGVPACYEARYVFPSRVVFDAYLRDHAPALRDEGLAKFPLSRGLSYARTVGEITHVHRAGPRADFP